jgi:hypothetical protein
LFNGCAGGVTLYLQFGQPSLRRLTQLLPTLLPAGRCLLPTVISFASQPGGTSLTLRLVLRLQGLLKFRMLLTQIGQLMPHTPQTLRTPG